MFERCVRGAAENYQQEKLDAFQAILLNAATQTGIDQSQQEYYLNLVMSLSVLHIRILHFLARPRDYVAAHGIAEADIRGGFQQMFAVAIPGVDLEVIKSAFDQLHQIGMTNTDKSMFSATTSGQGLELLSGRVSELGQSFIRFCTLPLAGS